MIKLLQSITYYTLYTLTMLQIYKLFPVWKSLVGIPFLRDVLMPCVLPHHLQGGSVHFAAAGLYQRRWVCLALIGKREDKLGKRSLVQDQDAWLSHTPLPVLRLSQGLGKNY
jgi:hypothetical protein